MTTPKISIIIPCYNMEAYLPQCLDSVLSQTLAEIEAICIDDGSRDNTGKILDEAQNSDPRLRVVHQENKGVAAARNLGISLSRGQYIAFLDSDDFLPDSSTLELLYKKADENHALICGGSLSNYIQSTGQIITCYTADSLGQSFLREGFIEYSDYQFDFGYYRFLYNRAFLLEHHLQFPLYTRYQDAPFFVQAMICAKRFYAIPQIVYRYRVGIQDAPTTWPVKKLNDLIRGHLDVLRISRENGLSSLHALTVRRFDNDNVCIPVQKMLTEGHPETLSLVQQFQDGIDPNVLPGYTIRALCPEGAAPRKRSIKDKLKTLFDFYKYNGFSRSLLLIQEKLTKYIRFKKKSLK